MQCYVTECSATSSSVLGVPSRADTVEELSGLLTSHGAEPLRWYGVWLFVDWLEFSGATLDPNDDEQVRAIAAVELRASRTDPYRGLSRVFHLVGRKAVDPGTTGTRERGATC
jgi:S-adenosylmethionine-dependent methyltransferase